MKSPYFLSFITSFILLIAACGQGGSSSTETKTKVRNFVGQQTIVLTNNGQSASEMDDFILKLTGNVVTVVDEDFSATAVLSSDDTFFLSSPSFSTTSDGITCTGNVSYSGTINGDNVSGDIAGEFNCSGIIFNVTGDFSAER
ncbi:MAG: hypothetical protein ACRBEE_01575 [Arenicella sp.]